jgi:hypothetical protein
MTHNLIALGVEYAIDLLIGVRAGSEKYCKTPYDYKRPHGPVCWVDWFLDTE